MSPFLADWAREISGRPKKDAAENMQTVVPQNRRKSRLVIQGLGEVWFPTDTQPLLKGSLIFLLSDFLLK
jgi:hypothetical protein